MSCISKTNQECKTRPQVINVNGDEPLFFPFNIETSKCSGSCNKINCPYAKICVPDIVKKLNVKLFNLMSRTNETRFIEWHETCKCECIFGENVCNNKQRWNKNKCRCECKELIDKGVCNKENVWNLNNRVCECEKTCNIGESLDYENYKCRKKLVDELVDECTEIIEEGKVVKITLVENENIYKCSSCTGYIVFVKRDRIVNPIKNTFLTNPSIFIYTMSFFSLNINISSFIISTKILNITSKSVPFHIIC